MFGKLLSLPLLAAVVISACGGGTDSPGRVDSPTYAGTWVVGEHQLKHMERSQGVRGEIAGSGVGLFFVGAISFAGSVSSEQTLTFAWEPRSGEIVITTLPLSKFRFVIEESREVPTVEFIFNSSVENYLWVRDRLANGNPNDQLQCGNNCYFGGLSTAMVKISAKTLQSEVYLPK